MERWPNQQRAFDLTADAIRRGVRRVCVVSPTGSGKTSIMFDQLLVAHQAELLSCLYTHRTMLYEQTAEKLTEAGISYGKRASGHEKNLQEKIQLIMRQSEVSQVYNYGTRDLHNARRVLIDEAHDNCGDTMQRIMADHIAGGAIICGYTATPLDLAECYDELLIAGTPSECRSFGALVPAETFAPDEPDLRHVKNYRVGDDLTENQNKKAIMRPGVFGRVLSAWKQHNPEQKPTLLFAPDVKGSIFFAEQFTAAGIPAAHIDGDDVWMDGECFASSQEMRDLLRERLERGELKVVCNRFVLREGIDWPFVECGIFATVFGSLTSYIQSGGRLLRASPNKEKAIVLDHGGNWWRHGSLNADRDWQLGMTNYRMVGERLEKMREKMEPQPITCPQCKKVRASGAACPSCGLVTQKHSRMVVQVDGSLRPVEGAIMRPRRVKMASDTQQLWSSIYYRMRNAGKTFRQAEAYFCHLHHYWPPRDLKLMPRDAGDWWRRIDAVNWEGLQ